MRFVSLFAGVGGFDLGLTRSGHQCVGQVEIDKHARAVLDLQFPDIPKHNDVTTAIDWTESQSDSQRYRQMGNAVTVNVIESIGTQLGRLYND